MTLHLCSDGSVDFNEATWSEKHAPTNAQIKSYRNVYWWKTRLVENEIQNKKCTWLRSMDKRKKKRNDKNKLNQTIHKHRDQSV